MQNYQLLIAFILFVMYVTHKSRVAAILLISYGVYAFVSFFDMNSPSLGYYFVAMSAISFFFGEWLFYNAKVAAMCFYVLVPVNLIGFALWYNYISSDLYNVICAIILVIQFLSILPGIFIDGRHRSYKRNSDNMYRGFDGGKAYDTMYPISQTKKAEK